MIPFADEDFIDVSYGPTKSERKGQEQKFEEEWFDKASGKYSDPVVFGARTLAKLYPGYQLAMTEDYNADLLGLPGTSWNILPNTQLISNLFFVPLARRLERTPGILIESIHFGAYDLKWEGYEFFVFVVQVEKGMGYVIQQYVLHKGDVKPGRDLILSAALFRQQLHDEIWVFNQGWWEKDNALWKEVQKANWDDVILKDEFKRSLRKDVDGFFTSEAVYKDLGIPWKRGLIMYGPPGNGKTISIKAIMKTCGAEGFAPLYVKSFQSWQGEEAAMAQMFNKARQLSPCVIVLEDLDSLINDDNRSFFLNQLDGLEGNDGLLVIGSTNHFDQLDPGLSSRPSRFDRKYLFDDPDREERVLYCRYWQGKVQHNKDVDFPDSLVEDVADITESFSFAYLKEAFVSTLVLVAGNEGDKPEFSAILKGQIKLLRKELEGTSKPDPVIYEQPTSPPSPVVPRIDNLDHGIRHLFDDLSESISRTEIRPARTPYNTPRLARHHTDPSTQFRDLHGFMTHHSSGRRNSPPSCALISNEHVTCGAFSHEERNYRELLETRARQYRPRQN